jgi:hypothetical protein
VAELALYDHKRHAFASHFDGMGVPQLVWSEPPAPLRPDGPTPLASTYTRSTTAPPPPPPTARLSASAAAARP